MANGNRNSIRPPNGKSSLNSVSPIKSFPKCVPQVSSMLPKMVMKNSENPGKRTSHHHFFKIVHPDQLTTQHLRIPSKFMKHISIKSYDGVILEGPSGRHWHAKLCRTRDGTYIREGWKEFVADHSLRDNEFVVFKYDGDMFFKIQIFDKNGCEREVYTSSETDQEPIVEKRKAGRPPKKKFDSCSSQKQSTPENTSASYSGNERGEHGPAKKKPVSRSGKDPDILSKKNASLEEPYPSTACKGNLGQKIKIEDEVEDEDHSLPVHETDTIEDEDHSLPIHEMDTKTTRCLSRRRTQTDEEAKLWKAVEAFSSSRPYFVRHLRTPTVWRTQYIPVGFSKTHFPRHHINIILRNQKGHAWTVKVCYTYDRYTFGGGWPAFVHANKLQEGDICIYELVGRLEFCVHIFRLLKEATICVL